MNKKSLIFLCLIPFCANATIFWNGVMGTGTAHANNENIQINSNTWLPNEIVSVRATVQDVTITMLNGPHSVYSSDDGQTILELTATYPWKITIIIEEDLRFGGVAGDITTPLIIQEYGDGEIEWILEKNKKLHFGTGELGRGGAILEVVYNDFDDYSMPRHTFVVQGKTESPQIFFGPYSGLKHLHIVFSEYLNTALFDASGGQPTSHQAYFKDGSGWVFQVVPIIT